MSASPNSTLPSFFPLDDTGLLSIEGADAGAFLQGQLSSDVRALVPGRGQWTSYNSAKGRVLVNGWLWQAPAAAERYDVLVAADLAAAMQKRLSMFVLRAKVRVVDRSPSLRFFGVAGEGARDAVAAALGRAPGQREAVEAAHSTTQAVALPDSRIVVVTPAAEAEAVAEALAMHASAGDAAGWRALQVAAGVGWITAPTSDLFVAQMLNWDALDGINFQKGCYPGQEVIARMRYLGRLKERLYALHADATPPAPGTRLFSPAFDDQPCGTVVNAVPADSGTTLLAVVQRAAAEVPGLTLGTRDGPALTLRPLPYPIPEDAAPRPRIA